MKRNVVIFTMLIFMIAVIAGCATTGTQQRAMTEKEIYSAGIYKTLAGMDAFYETNFTIFVEMYKQGLVKEETFKTGYVFAQKYFTYWAKAMDGMMKFEQGGADQTIVDAIMKELKLSMGDLEKFLADELAKRGKPIKPII